MKKILDSSSKSSESALSERKQEKKQYKKPLINRVKMIKFFQVCQNNSNQCVGGPIRNKPQNCT
jgi:hypothetical protein